MSRDRGQADDQGSPRLDGTDPTTGDEGADRDGQPADPGQQEQEQEATAAIDPGADGHPQAPPEDQQPEPLRRAERIGADGREPTADPDESLRRRVERLEAENTRLRQAYGRAVETTHRRTAGGFALIGVAAAVAALLFPDTRGVLVALAGTGLFAAVVTLYLSPERFIAADVGERVFAAQARNNRRLVEELGVSDHRLYLPAEGDPAAVLFVPQYDDYTLPEGPFESMLVVPEDDRARGVAFVPTGASLYDSFERTLTESVADRPGPLLEQVSETLAASFELIDATDVDIAPDGTGADIAVYGSVYGSGTRFDDPVCSVFAVGLAAALDRPVELDVRDRPGDDGYVVSLRWADDDPEA